MVFFVGRGSVEYLGVWSLVIRWIFAFFRWLFGSVIFSKVVRGLRISCVFKWKSKGKGKGYLGSCFFWELRFFWCVPEAAIWRNGIASSIFLSSKSLIKKAVLAILHSYMGIIISNFKAPYEPTISLSQGFWSLLTYLFQRSRSRKQQPFAWLEFWPPKKIQEGKSCFFNSIYPYTYMYIYILVFHESTKFCFFWMGLINQLQVKVPVARIVSFFFRWKTDFPMPSLYIWSTTRAPGCNCESGSPVT